MLIYRSYYVAAFLLALLCAPATWATVAGGGDIANSAGYYYDPGATLDIDTIRKGDLARQQFATADVPIGPGNHWIVLPLSSRPSSPGNRWLLEINFPNIDCVTATVIYANGSREEYVAGDEIAFSRWPIAYRKPSIPLDQLTQSDATVYLQVEIQTPLLLPLQLIEEQQQRDVQGNEFFLFGFFYGAVLVLMLYNAGVYFSLRDKSYIYYVLYILSFSLVQASTTGLGQQFLWPGLENATTRIALLTILLTNFVLIHFVIAFLDLERYRPGLARALRWLALFALLQTPLLALSHYSFAQYGAHSTNVLSMALIVYATLSVLRTRPRPAIYLLLSHSVLFSAIALSLMFQASLIEHDGLIDYSMSAAVLVEAIILALGLSERITQMRLENESAERESRIHQEQLSQQLIRVQEQERSELSKLLHDSVNHNLVVIRNRLENTASRSTQDKGEAGELSAMLTATIEEVRNLSHVTHPRFVQHLGLEGSLRALLSQSLGPNITWDLYIEPLEFSPDVELLLYRTTQECITNMLKYAEATECIVSLSQAKDGGTVSFLVKDDGKGFNAASKNWGFGLRILKEHCKLLGGSLDINSSPGSGCEVRLRVSPDAMRVRDE